MVQYTNASLLLCKSTFVKMMLSSAVLMYFFESHQLGGFEYLYPGTLQITEPVCVQYLSVEPVHFCIWCLVLLSTSLSPPSTHDFMTCFIGYRLNYLDVVDKIHQIVSVEPAVLSAVAESFNVTDSLLEQSLLLGLFWKETLCCVDVGAGQFIHFCFFGYCEKNNNLFEGNYYYYYSFLTIKLLFTL